VKVVGELVVEDAGADLEQEVGAAGCPAHLLFFDHALADDLVDRGFGERGGDGLASTLAFPVVGDPPGVGADVAVELADRLEQPGLLRAELGDVEIEEDVIDGLQGAEDVAVPAEPLQPLQLGCDLPAGPADGVPGRCGAGGGGCKDLAMFAMTVIRIVRWNQSSRCSACALR
jgi:hypothetical protein